MGSKALYAYPLKACLATQETVLAAHIVFSSANFDNRSASLLDPEVGGALPRIIDLLTSYNTAELYHEPFV
jgi:hypothetical protein